jgi:antitoxin component YwqK of YwqJK toxin-antitoxin module
MTIDEADLDLDEDISIYQEQPFTGVTQRFYPNGMLKRELNFCDGFEQGQCREWYSNGQLKREWNAVRGRAEGKVCEWHENGRIKTIAKYSKGVELSFDEWSDAGLLVTHREIDRQSELGKYADG